MTPADAGVSDVGGDPGGAAGGKSGDSGSGGSGGGAVIGGSGGASAQVHDCFPACVVRLRQACEKPAVGAGTCMVGAGGRCYSNGVRETLSFPNGGQLNVNTLPDGQTPCYQVFVDSVTRVLHFQTPAGVDVAQATALGDGGYSVTCDGMTQIVDSTDPTCATLNLGDCVAGTCP